MRGGGGGWENSPGSPTVESFVEPFAAALALALFDIVEEERGAREREVGGEVRCDDMYFYFWLLLSTLGSGGGDINWVRGVFLVMGMDGGCRSEVDPEAPRQKERERT
jgi:hypothetical protein